VKKRAETPAIIVLTKSEDFATRAKSYGLLHCMCVYAGNSKQPYRFSAFWLRSIVSICSYRINLR